MVTCRVSDHGYSLKGSRPLCLQSYDSNDVGIIEVYQLVLRYEGFKNSIRLCPSAECTRQCQALPRLLHTLNAPPTPSCNPTCIKPTMLVGVQYTASSLVFTMYPINNTVLWRGCTVRTSCDIDEGYSSITDICVWIGPNGLCRGSGRSSAHSKLVERC